MPRRRSIVRAGSALQNSQLADLIELCNFGSMVSNGLRFSTYMVTDPKLVLFMSSLANGDI
jgi:hypothetical protein